MTVQFVYELNKLGVWATQLADSSILNHCDDIMLLVMLSTEFIANLQMYLLQIKLTQL